MHLHDDDVTQTTNPGRKAQEEQDIYHVDMLQEVVERGAREQWTRVARWIVDVMTVIVPSTPMYSDGLGGQPLDTEEVRKAWRLDFEYVRQMGVYHTRGYLFKKCRREDIKCPVYVGLMSEGRTGPTDRA